MNSKNGKILLVGDNPFHGISHLSQERARSRGESANSVSAKANLVLTAVENGANGFMFSVSDLTLSILKNIREQNQISNLDLYAIAPYAFEYVRIATQTGTPGLAKRFVKQLAVSKNVRAILGGLTTTVQMNPEGLMKTFLNYELSRIESAVGKKANLTSVLLHEVVTDMGLALDFEWLFKSYFSFLTKKGITPGFNSRNLPFMIKKFSEWGIDLNRIVLATPFNEVGFQMNPSRKECEITLSNLSTPIVIAISVLAAGYFKPHEAANYLAGLKNLKGIVVGVSKEQHARESFQLFRDRL